MEELKTAKTLDKIVEGFKKLYDEVGITALSDSYVYEKDRSVSNRVKRLTNFETIATHLEILDEFKENRQKLRGKTKSVWTETNVKSTANNLIKEHGILPSATWLRNNGYTGFMAKIQKDMGGLPEFKKSLYSVEIDRYVCRGGLRHDSFAEACLANFLWARGIDVKRGRKYPPEFKEQTGHDGIYDLEFTARCGDYLDQNILVEIWGLCENKKGGPKGSDREKYVRKMEDKLKFNADNPCFIGMNFEDCYSENKLIQTLEPYIGICDIVRFGNDMDRELPPVNWTLGDEVLKKCQLVVDNIEGGVLPPINWFLHRNKYENREVFEWEPESYQNLPEQIQTLGGILKVRQLIKVEQNEANLQKNYRGHILWTKDTIISEVVKFFTLHQKWPQSLLSSLRCQSEKTSEETSMMRQCKNLSEACRLHIGNMEIVYNTIIPLIPINIRPSRNVKKWPVGVKPSPNGKFFANITIENKKIYLGTFETIEMASERYNLARINHSNGLPVK